MRFDLASFFDRQREIIEAAETPFAKLAIFILPILAPIVPASLTGLHLFKLFSEIFVFTGAHRVSVVLSILVSIVLEMLGYVGAVSFIQSIFRWVKTRNPLYALPTVLNGAAYAFYLILMFLVNYMLGLYFKTPQIINTIVGILSFMTVPTGLLAANYLSQKELKEEETVVRRERSAERIEKARIRAGKVSGNLPESPVTYMKDVTKVIENLPKDWRKLRPLLKVSDVRDLAHLSTTGVKKFSEKYQVDERTIYNWIKYAKTEIGENDESNK